MVWLLVALATSPFGPRTPILLAPASQALLSFNKLRSCVAALNARQYFTASKLACGMLYGQLRSLVVSCLDAAHLLLSVKLLLSS